VLVQAHIDPDASAVCTPLSATAGPLPRGRLIPRSGNVVYRVSDDWREFLVRVGIEMSVDAHSPLVLVHLDDNAVGISINKSAKFPFKIKDVFIGPIEF
jgi:hypothetical protein